MTLPYSSAHTIRYIDVYKTALDRVETLAKKRSLSNAFLGDLEILNRIHIVRGRLQNLAHRFDGNPVFYLVSLFEIYHFLDSLYKNIVHDNLNDKYLGITSLRNPIKEYLTQKSPEIFRDIFDLLKCELDSETRYFFLDIFKQACLDHLAADEEIVECVNGLNSAIVSWNKAASDVSRAKDRFIRDEALGRDTRMVPRTWQDQQTHENAQKAYSTASSSRHARENSLRETVKTKLASFLEKPELLATPVTVKTDSKSYESVRGGLYTTLAREVGVEILNNREEARNAAKISYSGTSSSTSVEMQSASQASSTSSKTSVSVQPQRGLTSRRSPSRVVEQPATSPAVATSTTAFSTETEFQEAPPPYIDDRETQSALTQTTPDALPTYTRYAQPAVSAVTQTEAQRHASVQRALDALPSERDLNDASILNALNNLPSPTSTESAQQNTAPPCVAAHASRP